MSNTYKTTDIYLAAALLVNGAKLVDIDRAGRNVVFELESEGDIKGMINSHMNDELMVPAKSYKITIQELKDSIFANED